MDSEAAIIASLRRAVAAMPDDPALRLHLAGLLLDAGQREESIQHLGTIVAADPAHAGALGLLRQATSTPAAGVSAPDRPAGVSPAGPVTPDASSPADAVAPDASGPPGPVTFGASSPADPVAPHGSSPASPVTDGGFDWAEAETELRGVLPPMFVTADGAAAEEPGTEPPPGAGQAVLRLADVAGMAEVKARLEAAFLAPLRNPDLRRLYRKSLRGGLLLYGPPGCGKTFIARAVAGELGASFLAVSFADVIDMFTGQSERNIRELFTIARRRSPCVLFLDEVDALGQKRSQLRSAPMRSAVNQLLLELDDVAGGNEGVFVLAASNHPWDVDSALRRPGRLDRTLLVLPPDEAARAAVFRFHLRGRPVAGIELAGLAAVTDGYSAADIEHVCESAAELALLDSVRSGEARMISQADLAAAVRQVSPSIGPWFESARNVALFANEGGAYDDLVAYLRQRKLL